MSVAFYRTNFNNAGFQNKQTRFSLTFVGCGSIFSDAKRSMRPKLYDGEKTSL